MLRDIMKNYNVHIFIGMFGSGKTEISLNMALKLKKEYKNVAIADIDVISPYFRVRDKKDELINLNIKVITPPEKYLHADMPIISREVGGYITNPEFKTVLDVGGNEEGATVLGSLRNFLIQSKNAVYFVVNTHRPFTENKENIKKYFYILESLVRTKIDYLVINSNIQNETTPEIIKEGEDIIESVSKEINVPIAFTVVPEKLEKIVDTKFEKFVIKRFFENYGLF